MSITFLILTLGALGAFLNTVILLGSIFKPKDSASEDINSSPEKLKLTLIIENEKGEVTREQANVNQRDASKVLQAIQNSSC
ncbi:MAG: hypothetical protein AAFQ80_05620 [Cyanobacteria bacterium J06621_8]